MKKVSSGRTFVAKSRVKQSFASEMDLTRIVSRHSGLLPDARYSIEARPYSAYSSLPDVNCYHDCLNKIADSNSAFEALPSMVRRYFGNSPQNFLSALRDTSRHPELVRLGILLPPELKPEVKSEVKSSEEVSS